MYSPLLYVKLAFTVVNPESAFEARVTANARLWGNIDIIDQLEKVRNEYKLPLSQSFTAAHIHSISPTDRLVGPVEQSPCRCRQSRCIAVAIER